MDDYHQNKLNNYNNKEIKNNKGNNYNNINDKNGEENYNAIIEGKKNQLKI